MHFLCHLLLLAAPLGSYQQHRQKQKILVQQYGSMKAVKPALLSRFTCV